MTPFLQLVAQDLCRKFGNDFSRTVIVFPNKRAGLFMNEYFLQLSEGAPVWVPRYITINELFLALAPDISINDPIDSTLRLVSLFRRLSGKDVTVDWFYGWAERILADFDDVDKNMADARLLFQNVNEWKQFDDTSFLTEEQVKELQHFFSEFDPEKKSSLRERYRELWDVLYEMYSHLNRELADEGTAYEGALYRRVVERLESGSTTLDPAVDRYVIVGFNVLDQVEQRLFKYLQKQGRALFYWDYDEYYTMPSPLAPGQRSHHEAGLFLRENLAMFPGELSAEHFRCMSAPKRLEMISASTEAIQAQYVAPWLSRHLTPDAKRTAVVLCNETLLQPVLHALPESIEELNVTKGFPLSHTEVASFVEHKLNDWERRKLYKPMVEMLSELTALVNEEGRNFVVRTGGDTEQFESVLQSEAYYTMFTILNRFTRIMQRYVAEEQMTLVTLRRLIRAVVRQSSIAFHGEPAVGLQVMGVLETRCLDFDHIIMLSVNDGTLPKRANDNSFIPYALRRAYHLTTPERRTAVYAYYFYRLLQRAQHVTMTYNTSAEGMSTGEMSRFMTQLLVEWPGRVEHFMLNSRQHSTSGSPRAVAKPHDLLERMKKEGAKLPSISPSLFKDYLECQLRFYYKKILGISEPKDPSNEMKANTFGTIFHRAAEIIYLDILEHHSGNVAPDYLKKLASDHAALKQIVEKAFADCEVEHRVLEACVIEMYLANMLRCDARNGHFLIIGAERKTSCFFTAEREGKPVDILISGTVDRIDLVSDEEGHRTLRVLDYKTGSATSTNDGSVDKAKAKELAELFARGGKKAYMLQTFLYDKMLRNEARHDAKLQAYMQYPVSPALFFIRGANRPDYNPCLYVGDHRVTDLSVYEESFDEHLRGLLNEILDPMLPFEPTTDAKTCETCAYAAICHSKGGDEAK